MNVCPLRPNPLRLARPGPCKPARGGRLLLTVVGGLLLTTGCSLVQLRQEAATFDAATVLAGRADCSGNTAPVVVAAMALDTQPPVVAHHTRLHECGGWELMVGPGRHTVAAFVDLNGNGRHDPGEPLAHRAEPVDAPSTGLVTGLDLTLDSGPGNAELARHWGLDRLPPRARSTQAGVVTPLHDPALSPAQGERGYWAPLSFFREHGGNVVFLQPYDPQRVPVLFVHGAVGSPRDLAPLIDRLDRSRYQPWVFHYPSGASLDSMASLLYWKLLNLQLRYRFTQLAVVAHSMGGLVVQRLIGQLGPELAPPRLFVSVSTPWGGEPGAELGVRHSPAVVPSWHDMQPGSAFLAGLFNRPLPAPAEHLLLFGHKGGYSLMRPTTDGTVTLASQLRPEAQAQARRVLGFDEDHMGILSSPQVAQLVAAALDRALQPGASASLADLQVQLALQPGAAPGLPMLRLRPLDGGSPLALTLAGHGGPQPLGQLPPGRYEASLLAPGHAAQPQRVPIHLAPGQPAALSFTLQPVGSLTGWAVSARVPARLPAGARQAVDDTLHLRRVLLTGPDGLRRELRPAPGPLGDAQLDALLDGHDVAAGATWAFTHLPDGRYELLLEADGHQAHRSVHQVRAGQPADSTPLRLQPLPGR